MIRRRRSELVGARRGRIRIGIDTGGTFTDFHVVGPGLSLIFKLPSTPADPAAAVLMGIERILHALEESPGVRLRLRPSIIHGTTVGTNALLTRGVARTAFLTTRGFEDLIEIARQNRDSLYDLDASRSPPLVPRSLRFGLDERVFVPPREPGARDDRSRASREAILKAAGPTGSTDPGPRAGERAPAARLAGRRSLRLAEPAGGRLPSARRDASGWLASAPARIPPSREEVARIGAKLRARGVASIAVGFLHSYLDPTSEIEVGRALEGLGLPTTLSHEIAGEYREYERFSTAIANASLQPGVGRYVGKIGRGVGRARLWILQSDGTTATGEAASREPVRTVLSGPAGGALAALGLARRLGDEKVLSFDMGGTSTDALMIDGGLPRVRLGRIAGLPIRSPMIDVRTVGAGGGSIARRDAAGALRVGPESAGADPGPACYGRGDQPTVTDAHLFLGRLGARDLLGGDFPVDLSRARRAIARLARSLRLDPQRAAEGVLRVVEAAMERALRAISLEQGLDPRRFVLYAFGGAGGLHACALAERLGIGRVVIPPAPGVFSATGLCGASPGVELSATVLAAPADKRGLEGAFKDLERRALGRLREQGIARGLVRFERLADLRYAGQSHEITVRHGEAMREAFERAHRERYGHGRPDAGIEVVTVRLRATRPLPPLAGLAAGVLAVATPRHQPDGDRKPTRQAAVAPVGFNGRTLRCRVLPREAIGAPGPLRGPARVTEYSGTTFIAPGWSGRAGRSGTLVLTRARGSARRPARGAGTGRRRGSSTKR